LNALSREYVESLMADWPIEGDSRREQ
jgi:hypothetical protein